MSSACRPVGSDLDKCFTVVYFLSSEGPARPGTSVDGPPPSAAARQLQYHLPVLSQEGLQRLQKGAKRSRPLPRMWRLRLPQRRVLQTAGGLRMRFGKFLAVSKSHHKVTFCFYYLVFPASADTFIVRLTTLPFCFFWTALPTLWRSYGHLSTDKCLGHHHHPGTSLLPVGFCLPRCPRGGGPRFTVQLITHTHTHL